jgi:LPXTG-motif cell wall-anchored protein
MAEDPIGGGSTGRFPMGPAENPPSLVVVLILDLVGTLLVAIGFFVLLVPDQQWIPQSTGLPDNAIGLLVLGILLIGIAVYLLIKRVRISGAVLSAFSGNDT